MANENVVNAIATEPLKGFQPKLTQTSPVDRPQNNYVFKVMASKVTGREMAKAYPLTVRRRLLSSVIFYMEHVA